MAEAATVGNLGKGTLLQHDAGAGMVTISEVRDISGPGFTRDVVDGTHQESPKFGHESIPGLIQPGEVTFSIIYLPDNATQQQIIQDLAIDRDVQDFQISVPLDRSNPPGSTDDVAFKGYVTSFQPNYPMADIITADMTITISEVTTFTT